jgi:hypothetical protein
MIILQTVIKGIEVWVVLVSDTEQRSFMSHAAALTCALRYTI